MTQNELFEIALTTDPAQIGHHVQGGYMTGIYPISDDIKAIGPAFTIRLPGTDNAMLYYAMKQAPKGSMIVIEWETRESPASVRWWRCPQRHWAWPES